MNYKEIELNIYEKNENNEKILKETKNIKFRLLSCDCVSLENMSKKSTLEFIQDESVTMIITMLRYMRMSEDRNFSIQQAQKLYDQLIDDGWTYKKIIQDIIYETMVVSGFLEESEWEEMKEETQEALKKFKEAKMKALEKI